MARRKVSHKSQEALTQRASAVAHDVANRFGRFSFEKRIAIVFLGLLTFFVVFFPLVRFVALDGGESASLRFLSLGFWKSSVLIIILLATLWGRYLSPRFKQTIHSTLGFKDNDYLFTFFVLFVWFGLMVGMQESIAFASGATTTVSMGFGYYALLILLLVGLVYSLVRLLDEAKILRKTDFMGFIQSSRSDDYDRRPDVSSLFDSEEVDEEEEKN